MSVCMARSDVGGKERGRVPLFGERTIKGYALFHHLRIPIAHRKVARGVEVRFLSTYVRELLSRLSGKQVPEKLMFNSIPDFDRLVTAIVQLP